MSTNFNTNIVQKQTELFGVNPVIQNLKKTVKNKSDDKQASCKGIIKKCVVFLFTIIIGVLLATIMHSIHFETIIFHENISANMPELIAASFAVILFIVSILVCCIAKRAIPLFGSLFCISVGYIYTFMANLFKEYREAIFLALVITLAIFATVILAYMSGKIKLTGKIRTYISIMFTSIIVISIVLLIFSLIPGLREITMFVTGNPAICIAFSIIGVILATLSLVKDVDTINQIIKNKMSAKYEWMASFSLIFSLIWIFMEVLELILKLKNK